MERILLAALRLSGAPVSIEDLALTLTLSPEEIAGLIVALEDKGHVTTSSDGKPTVEITPAGIKALDGSFVIDDIPADVPETINAAFAEGASDTFLAGLRSAGYGGSDARLLRYLAAETATRMALKTNSLTILVRAARADAVARALAAHL